MPSFAQATTKVCLVLFMFPSIANSQDLNWISDPVQVQKIVSTIPVVDRDLGYKSLWERLPNLGMTVNAVKTEIVNKGDAEPPIYLVGDRIIKLETSKPNGALQAICPFVGYPEFVQRGKKFIPQNLSANWLMTNRCHAPN